jgi:prepilin signal peptidase PulO-like enzyme (type II secretory pathway)
MNNILCPKCNHHISLGNLIISLSPYHIQCNKCRAILKIKYSKTIMIIAIIYGFSITTVLSYFEFSFIYFILYLVIGIFLFEILLYWIIRLFNIGLRERNYQSKGKIIL